MPIPTITTSMPGLDKQIKMLDRAKPEIFKAVKIGIGAGTRVVRSAVAKRNPVFSERSKKTWKSKVESLNGYWSGRVYPDSGSHNPSRSSFWVRIIVSGRAAGKKAPRYKDGIYPKTLVAWVESHLSPSPVNLRSTLFRVARSIGRKGIAGRPFVAEGIRDSEQKAINAVNATVKRVLEKMAREGSK